MIGGWGTNGGNDGLNRTPGKQSAPLAWITTINVERQRLHKSKSKTIEELGWR